ncbi:MAG: ATP-binding cassette domain-containing protein [Clostridia bacterium]|nr:ATP-binding cassette domain-containing protein [Clostridia bacterium]
MEKAIIAKNLKKVYKTFEKEEGIRGSLKSLFVKKNIEKIAVRDFNMVIEQGEMVGLIGPNGAGKTTLIKMLTGVIHPASGEVSVFGHIPHQQKEDFKKSFAVVMGQKSQLWWDLPAVDSFLLNKEIYGIHDDEYRKNLAFFSELFAIGDLMRVQVRNLSLGERMKMELVTSLLHNPKMLFLDEPTIGLDAVAQKQMREFLREINKTRGVTIILTSHYMEDIKHLCKRTIVIRNGEKIYDGSLQELLDKNQFYRTISISFETPTDIQMDFDAEWIEKNPFKSVFKVRKTDVKPVLQTVMQNYEIDDISIEDEEIGSVVEKIYTAGTGGSI